MAISEVRFQELIEEQVSAAAGRERDARAALRAAIDDQLRLSRLINERGGLIAAIDKEIGGDKAYKLYVSNDCKSLIIETPGYNAAFDLIAKARLGRFPLINTPGSANSFTYKIVFKRGMIMKIVVCYPEDNE